MTLDKYYNLVINTSKKSLKNFQISDVQDTEINGLKAKTYIVNGDENDIKLEYLYGIVELPNSYVKICTWSSPSKFDKNKDTLMNIIESFKTI